jgi:hypothetical protein
MKKSSGSGKEAKPLKDKEEVQKNPDKHIDQDFPGYPHPPSQEKTIDPKTKEDKAGARLIRKEKYTEDDEQNSDGSANAFSESENDVLRGELDDDDEKTY